MNRSTYISLLGLVLALYPLSVAQAAEPSTIAGQETGSETRDNQLIESTDEINRGTLDTASRNQVVDRLKDQFNVDDQRIETLRNQKLGFGEVGIVLSLANQMPGGINDANIAKIMNMRQGDTSKAGWSTVAKNLNLNLNRTIGEVNRTGQAVPATLDTTGTGPGAEGVNANSQSESSTSTLLNPAGSPQPTQAITDFSNQSIHPSNQTGQQPGVKPTTSQPGINSNASGQSTTTTGQSMGGSSSTTPSSGTK